MPLTATLPPVIEEFLISEFILFFITFVIAFKVTLAPTPVTPPDTIIPFILRSDSALTEVALAFVNTELSI